jgi:hypothetical protein
MHIHLPKPLHGWRAFAGEVGIIVVGVLVALGAQQVVETLHWQQRVDDAEASMIKELGEDDGPQALARLALSPCISQHLEAAEQALIAERDHQTAFVRPAPLTPAFRTWDDDGWRASVSSDATSHMTTERMQDWEAPYAFIPDMNAAAIREFSDWGDVSRITLLRPHPSETEREAMLAAIARARQDNELLTAVNSEITEGVPAPMQPLEVSFSNSSASSANQTK